MTMPLTVVVVSYNVASLLERCLSSVIAERSAFACGASDRVVVVDNASSDGSVRLVQREFPQVQVLANQTNLGFGAGCNQGLAEAARGGAVLFLNPDTELAPGALRTLLDRLETAPRAALVGPSLRYADGRPQPSRRRFPTITSLALESTPVDWRLPAIPQLRRYRCVGEPHQPGRVDWLSGACQLGRVDALRDVGGFDPAFFMYFEEVDLSRRLAARGWETWYEPAAAVLHHHSQSADQDVPARERRYLSSKLTYAARYFGPSSARLVMLAGAAAFGAEAAIQTGRRDPRLLARNLRLARLHLALATGRQPR